jgi:hypothetical protein
MSHVQQTTKQDKATENCQSEQLSNINHTEAIIIVPSPVSRCTESQGVMKKILISY